MLTCRTCGKELSDESRYCTRCGRPVHEEPASISAEPPAAKPLGREKEEMNMTALYLMVVALLLAIVFPPWETPPEQPPQFLGFHFIFNPPSPGAMVSRLLLTIELVTVAVAGLYFSWLFRKRD